MSEVMVGVIALCVLLALFLTGIEMGFAMAIIGFLGCIPVLYFIGQTPKGDTGAVVMRSEKSLLSMLATSNTSKPSAPLAV